MFKGLLCHTTVTFHIHISYSNYCCHANELFSGKEKIKKIQESSMISLKPFSHDT